MISDKTKVVVAIVASLLFSVFTLGYIIGKDSKTGDLQDRLDNLVQERGHSWIKSVEAPDSIYFISFAKDTTWYTQKIQHGIHGRINHDIR